MRINQSKQDEFPKLGLNNKNVAEGYPLCADLHDRHFLKAGAKYRLIDSTGRQELQHDLWTWGVKVTVDRFSADRKETLYETLCSPKADGSCSLAPFVTLENDIPCSVEECMVNTIRSIELQKGVFYEYIRVACVHQDFHNNAKKFITASSWIPLAIHVDPRTGTEAADSACCDILKDCCKSPSRDGYRGYRAKAEGQIFTGEKMTYDSAEIR